MILNCGAWVDMGTSQFMSVPYALHAKTAETINETDPVFGSSVAAGITGADTTNWNNTNKLDVEVDALEQKLAELESILFGTYSISDIDGNTYKTIKIGTQVWMAENLKTTKYSDNTPIPLESNRTIWANLTTPAYCYFNNDSATYAPTYGALYNWYAVNTGNLCPSGWHVPSAEEWMTLITYLGGTDIAGGKLKQRGYTHWNAPNTGATNETGFAALPAGIRAYSGSFGYMGEMGYWWTATHSSSIHAVQRGMSYDHSRVLISSYPKNSGYSIRCLRD
jgi:uncharacterized protein (TIGR02145 family)